MNTFEIDLRSRMGCFILIKGIVHPNNLSSFTHQDSLKNVSTVFVIVKYGSKAMCMDKINVLTQKKVSNTGLE